MAPVLLCVVIVLDFDFDLPVRGCVYHRRRSPWIHRLATRCNRHRPSGPGAVWDRRNWRGGREYRRALFKSEREEKEGWSEVASAML